MSGNQWLSYTVAIVVGVVVGVLTAGIGLGAYAGTVGVLAFGVTSSLMLSRNAGKGTGISSAAAQELEIATASETVVVPVYFGLVRVAGNFMRVDISSFEARGVEDNVESGGKGGGGSQTVTVGYEYFLSYLYGLGIGPLDGIGDIWDGNEMKKVSEGYTSFTGDTMTRTIAGNDFGGDFTIFRGTDTQPVAEIGGSGMSDTWLNYYHTAYAWFEQFKIGSSPTPRTLLFECHRWPVCVDDAGVDIPSIIKTGSNDNTGRTWYDANAAAVIFEVLTNKIWGRGLPVDMIDVASFAAASQFFADNDLGISLALTDQSSLADIIDFVRRHLNTCCVWDGGKLRLFVLMNPDDDAVPVTITRDQVTKPRLQRPAWPETANELRVEFIERSNAWKTEIAHVQDDAAIGAVGGLINSQKATLTGFTNRYTAESQARRILREQSYPQATLSFYMNRWASGLVPGRRVRFVWDELTPQLMNTFWRVVETTDNEQSSDGIRVMLAEDLYATPYLGDEQAFEAATPGFEGDSFNEAGDVTKGEDSTGPYDPGDLQPLRAFELSIGKTYGTKQFAILCQRGSLANHYALHKWAPDGGSLFTTFAQTQGWCITGKLLSAVPTTARDIQRGASGITFTFDLTDPGDEGDLLSSANKIQVDADGFEPLLSGMTDLLIIGNEVFFVGLVEETTPGVYRASNFIRAQMGTTQAAHAINDDVYFISLWKATKYVVGQGDIPSGQVIDFLTLVATAQSGLLATNFAWSGPAAGGFLGTGALAYVPGYLSHAVVGSAWAVQLRPRWHNCGAESSTTIEGDMGNFTEAIPDGYGLYVEPFNGVTSLAARAPVISSYTSDADPTGAGGVWSFTFNAPGSTNKIRVWAAYKGGMSLDYIELTP